MRTKSTLTEAQMNEFIVLLKFNSQPHTLAVTYKTNKSNVVTQINELDAAESVITSCKFKGRSSSGDCSDDIKELKKLITQFKPKDWPDNKQYVDSFHKVH
jgi:hypothetical protein